MQYLCPALDYALSDSPVVDPWNPRDISSLLQFALEPSQDPYHPSTLNGVHHLASRESFGTYRAPRQGRCWLFDGINDQATQASLPVGSSVTFCAWIRPTNAANQSVAYFNSLANAGCLLRYQGSTVIQWFPNTLTTVESITIPNISSTWSHVAITQTGTAWAFYLNGSLIQSGTTVALNVAGNGFTLGRYDGASSFNGSIRDARIYSTAKTLAQIAAIHAGDYDAPDEDGLLAGYWCNDEAGTVGRDWSANGRHLTLTNIAEQPFHATDISITTNPTNIRGGTVSGNAIIPIRPGASLDVLGSTPTFTGKAPYPVRVDVPCVTSPTSVNLGSQLIPTSGDFEVELYVFFDATAVNFEAVIGQVEGVAWSSMFGIWFESASWRVAYGSYITNRVSFTPILSAWNLIQVRKVSTTLFVSVNGGSESSGTCAASLSTPSINTTLFQFLGGLVHTGGRVANLAITTGGVTTTFPLQEGPGTSNTNRNVHWTKSDGTSGVVTNAIVGGDVATIWANRAPGLVRDSAILNGAGIAANGSVIPVNPVSGLCADGSTPTIAAGSMKGNPFSRYNENPFTAAELNGTGVSTAFDPYTTTPTALRAVAPADTKFIAVDGTRRITLKSAATGADLTNLLDYLE